MYILRKYKSNSAIGKQRTGNLINEKQKDEPNKPHLSDSPSHFDIRSDDDTEKNVELFASVATAFAI